jgi:hypothetical protein
MLYALSVDVHFVDVDTRYPCILRVVIEQIQKIHVRPNVVADGDDAMDHNASQPAFRRDLAKELSQRLRPVGNERVVLDVRGTGEPGRGFLRLLPVDHQIVEGEDSVLVANSADVKIVLDGIRVGFVAGTMAQNSYGQGYIGAYVLDLLASGCKVKDDAPFQKTPQTAKFIDSGTVLIQKSNLDSYKDDLKEVSVEIQSGFKDKFLACK